MRLILFFLLVGVGLNSFSQEESLDLNLENAKALAAVPIECIWQEYPNKLNQVLADSTHLQSPQDLHPIFYGCFDWHSSVHGHWLMARMMNKFPDSELAADIVKIFDQQFTVPNVQKELAYFLPKVNKSFERTYGWAWYLKLVGELSLSERNEAHQWTKNLQSLTDRIVSSYKAFLPKLVYPIRVGEHTNTAFGLSLAMDYARIVGDQEFVDLIIERSMFWFVEDAGCPIDWEPSGFDFISPCLQEAELMSKVLDKKSYKKWMEDFLPQLMDDDFQLKPGKVVDRTDGKLVHLDGLNFCRAWCLYRISESLPKQKEHLTKIADQHVMASSDKVLGSDYMGSHWLASFMIYALENRERSLALD